MNRPAVITRASAARQAGLVLVFGLLAVLCIRQVGSLDTGFHLKTAAWILEHHAWPRTDPFTFTINDHPYIDMSWGYQLVLHTAHRLFGAPGIVLMHAALVLGVFFIVCRTARLGQADPATLLLLLLAGTIASELRFEARPELVSWLFLALVLHILHRHARGLAAPLPALALIHLVWANTHSLFILGWAAAGCFVVGLSLAGRRLDRKLLGWSLASVLVTFINPYGWRGMLFPFSLATRLQGENLFGQSIGEFVSPFDLGLTRQFPFHPRLPILCYRILALLAVVAIVPLLRRRRFACVLVLILFLSLSALMIRNVPLLVVAGLPILAWALPASGLLQRLGLRRALVPAVAVATVILALGVVHDGYYAANRRPERFGLGFNRLVLPIDAAQYADRAHLDGPMLNHLNFGGWLLWARPQPVFIDGRLEVTGERFYRYYQNALGNEGDLEAVVSRYDIRWIVFPYATNPRLLGRLSKDGRWRLAYVDHLAALFVREGPDAAAFVDPVLASLSSAHAAAGAAPVLPGIDGAPRLTGLRLWAEGLVRHVEFPTDDFQRGLFHYFRGELEAAERRFVAAAVQSRGAWYEVYNNLAAVYWQQRRYDEAAACYRVVLADDPSNTLARERLASMPAGTAR